MWPNEPAFGQEHTSDDALSLRGAMGSVVVGAMPAPVPEAEADAYSQYSAGFIGRESKPLKHAAHLIVAFMPTQPKRWFQKRPNPSAQREELRTFIRVLAALAVTTPSVGVYWNRACATHPVEFFVKAASEDDFSPLLWSGIEWITDRSELRLLSLGMAQVELPNLLLTAPLEKSEEAFECFETFLRYVADRGSPIGEGESIGRSADEKLLVHYTSSPRDDTETVWSVALA